MPCLAPRFAICLSLLLAASAHGGGGPENVFLVVNSASAGSQAIAKHYAGLRRIPPSNLFSIAWRGSRENIPVERFRNELLKPILQAIDARKLSAQIDYLVYSSDFPWRIDLRGDLKEQKTSRVTHPYASLTGATYLYEFVNAKSPAILGLRTNWYMPGDNTNLRACRNVAKTLSRGFRGRRRWNAGESDASKPTLRYLLSTMLAVTSGRGNSVDEVRNYLTRAALADADPPQGTFYFVRNKTARSQPRHNCYAAVANELRKLGAKAEVIHGKMAKRVNDALGLVSGIDTYDLTASQVKLMPGAIGDNLTSYGGILSADYYQTPLSEMLRHGAAGASGAVFEPTAVQAKFPLPTLMLHYRRGCSLAEAFYQSIASPYQLLIVGDPLCQPWAVEPRVTVPNLPKGLVVTKPLVVRPTVRPAGSTPVKAWELFIDGRLIARTRVGVGIRVMPESLTPGEHELRVVAADSGPIESQGRWISNVFVPQPTAKHPPNPHLPAATPPPGRPQSKRNDRPAQPGSKRPEPSEDGRRTKPAPESNPGTTGTTGTTYFAETIYDNSTALTDRGGRLR